MTAMGRQLEPAALERARKHSYNTLFICRQWGQGPSGAEGYFGNEAVLCNSVRVGQAGGAQLCRAAVGGARDTPDRPAPTLTKPFTDP